MSSEQAARVVFVAGMIEAGYVLVRATRGGLAEGGTYKSLWAIGLLTLGLAVFADFVPQIAGPFALLVLVAMIVRNRGELGSTLTGRGHSGEQPPRAVQKRRAAKPGGPRAHPEAAAGRGGY